MKPKIISIGKPEDGCINEDAAIARDNMIAVSDGAGGGGLFAERWSRYLLDNLPESPILSAEELDLWIDGIWEPYYNQCEEDAKMLGGMSLNKFYDEGSFATLVAVWKTSESKCEWMSYGDSVAFHYNYATHKLEHSFSSLADFDKPPYLINCKDELNKSGFKNGVFEIDKDSVVFVASDALAHYIMMMYEVSQIDSYFDELNKAESNHSKNENYIKAAKSFSKFDFEKDIIIKLQNCIGNGINFKRHIKKILNQGLLAHDDYSLVFFNS